MKKKKPGKNEKFHVQVPRKTGKKREVLDEKVRVYKYLCYIYAKVKDQKKKVEKEPPHLLPFVTLFLFLFNFLFSCALFAAAASCSFVLGTTWKNPSNLP